MSYQRDRDEFISIATQEGLSLDIALKLLRYATRLQRLAVAQCNGDWPADNGERKVEYCPDCESGFVKSSFVKGICPDCRAGQLVSELLAPTEAKPILGGDPRGAVLKITVPSGRTNDWGRTGIYVPARN